MTSFRQFEANRSNSQKSTGPNTEQGKRRSRRNAVRHGLCAETGIEIVEERELVLRLASLLWRIRRATSIETDLMRFQAEILHKRRSSDSSTRPPRLHYRVLQAPPDEKSDWGGHWRR